MNRFFYRLMLAACLVYGGLYSAAALSNQQGQKFGAPTILETLSKTDGTQALVAAVLVVDEAQVLSFSLAELLGDSRAEIVLLAPSNAAFEKLLSLDEGALNGLSVEDVKSALPALLPPGVGAPEVAAILLKHAALPERADRFSASENALLAAGEIVVADGSVLPVGIGASGVGVNNEATITKANIVNRNGFIHYIDEVILDDLL